MPLFSVFGKSVGGVVLVSAAQAVAAFCTEPAWPQFRGPEANPVGRHVRLPERWSPTENVEWSSEIPGRGWSSPVVVGNRVFVTTAVTDGPSKKPQLGTDFSNDYAAELKKQGLSDADIMARVKERDMEMPHEVLLHYYLYCLDLRSGKVQWRREYHAGRPPVGRHRKNSFTSETPVTDGKRLYVYAGNLGLYAYDLNGKLIWKTPLEAYPIYLDFGTGGSAALHENLLIIVNDNEKQQFIAAFDKRTGKEVWRALRDLKEAGGPPRQSGWSTPYIWKNSLRTEIVTNGPGTYVSYDLNGKELWRMRGVSVLPIPMPFAYDGLLYVNGGAGRRLFAVREGAVGDITLEAGRASNKYVAWSQERAGTYLPTQVAYDGALYVLSEKGIMARYEAKTGKLSYKARIDAEAGAFTSSPWAYNGLVFCISEEGKTYVLKAGEKFELMRVNELGEMAQATPAIVGERLLVRTEGRLWAVRRNSGSH
ncbi:MAG TPA: PQQ-binding-like beta-propeller repeat protein [Bryobacteraceae bacterium]|nr:PQQ-binding-like beta-propeller repeat protein [Bryobacteraceae bacterium]